MPDPRTRVQLVVSVAVIAVALLGGAWYGSSAPMPPPLEVTPAGSAPGPPEEVGTITVHVAGAVVRPGLVSVPAGSRVADVIAAAGGALPVADIGSLNLAAPVGESDRIEVPLAGANGAAAPGSATGADGVDINRATAAELETLSGVGPVLAERIVAHREDHGPFRSVEDLLDVPGIGEAKLAAIRDAVRVP